MKKSLLLSAGLSLSVLTMGSFLVGCKTTGNERSEDTRTSMQSVENDILQLKTQLNATSLSLDTLFSPQQADVKQAFEVYSKNARQIQDAGDRFLKHTDAMAARGADYFSEWSKQGENYTNPQIHAISEERRVELATAFSRIAQTSFGVRGALQAYLADIKDIHTFLSTDLTSRGLESMKPSADKAIQDGLTLRTSIEPVLTAVADARLQMSPAAAPTPR